jgi:hypothetical protein
MQHLPPEPVQDFGRGRAGRSSGSAGISCAADIPGAFLYLARALIDSTLGPAAGRSFKI